jgi:hypothetical protein
LSYILDGETREKRLLINDRVTYGLRRSELKGSIRWLLKLRGLDDIEKPFSREGRGRLRALKLREIDIRLDERELVDSIAERLDGEISQVVSIDDSARLLDTLPGVPRIPRSFSPPRSAT